MTAGMQDVLPASRLACILPIVCIITGDCVHHTCSAWQKHYDVCLNQAHYIYS